MKCWAVGYKILLGLLISFSVAFASELTHAERRQYEKYFSATYKSLECLRDVNGFVQDKFVIESNVTDDDCPGKILISPTTATNIALDILVQLEALRIESFHEVAALNLQKIINTLARVPYHQESGLFFNLYSTDSDYAPHRYVSAVDNLHLYVALWTLHQSQPKSSLGAKALELFNRMNFNFLYDDNTGLFWGGLRYSRGTWIKEEWAYRYFGSESRSIYSFAWAFNVIDDPGFLLKSFQSFSYDFYLVNGRSLLGLWDGGAFQLYLPKLLMNEELYSSKFKTFYAGHASFIISKSNESPLGLPAAYSASQFGTTNDCPEFPCYNGKAGNLELVASLNSDVRDPYHQKNWELSFTPHAAFLAATENPSYFAQILTNAEKLGKDSLSLYQDDVGWFDGIFVKGPNQGKTIPVILSLNQGMIALSIAQILSPSGLGITSQFLYDDEILRSRMAEFYRRAELLGRVPELQSSVLRKKKANQVPFLPLYTQIDPLPR